MYNSFAAVYDAFMEEVPYEAWCGYINRILKEDEIRDGLVLDLGCGTGTATLLLAQAGYDMIGVDSSEEMLMTAREKCAMSGRSPGQDGGILLLHQDMRSFELYGTVRAVVSMCDTLNYCENEDELLKVFSLVNNYLDPGGLFIFDMNTIHKYRDVLGDNVFAASEDAGAYIWENSWFEDELVNQYDLTLFIREGEESNLFSRYTEIHTQRAFPDSVVRRKLSEAGLKLEMVTEAYSDRMPSDRTERILYVARETGKHR
ncbi:MAG: class I SAM-dependent methyltransferase [Lachnospiraceae bacterium]|nr:class I SAM-dependent methyltransferase [Lachnospiraceae bacterium]